MSSTWGILGNPTKQEIEAYMNLPYGKFKDHVSSLSKKYRGKSLRTYTIKVHEVRSDTTRAFLTVRAFDANDAVEKAQMIPKRQLNWETSPFERDKYVYEYYAVQVK